MSSLSKSATRLFAAGYDEPTMSATSFTVTAGVWKSPSSRTCPLAARYLKGYSYLS
jgi:hypothetical protein